MSCNIQNKTKDHFKNKGLLTEGNIIPTEKLELFEAENDRLTKVAKDTKGVDLGKLFEVSTKTIERSKKKASQFIARAIPNKEAFEAIENYNDNNQTFEKKLTSLNKDKKQSYSSKLIFGNKETKVPNAPKQNFVILEEERQANLNEIREKLFNSNLTNQTANQFLRNALYNLDINDETRRIAKTMLTTRAKIKFVSKQSLASLDTYAQYNSNTRTIEINREILGTGNLGYAFESILHEIVHDFTVHAIMNPKNDSQRKFRDNIQDAYKRFKALSSRTNEYGFENEYEFVAELMSNSEFRKHLRSLKDDTGTNIFQRILNYLKRLFGGSNNNINDVIESVIEISEKEYDNYKSLTDYNYQFQKQAKPSDRTYSESFKKELVDTKSLISEIYSRIDAIKSKSRSKKGYASKDTKKFEKLEKLLKNLQDTSTNELIYEFTSFANKEINSLLKMLDKKEEADEITSDFLFRSNAYISIYNSINDIKKLTERQRKEGLLKNDEYNKVFSLLNETDSNFKQFNIRYLDLARDLQARRLTPFNPRPIDERRLELQVEYNKLGLKASGVSKSKWIEDQIDEELDDLRQEAFEEVRRMLDFIPSDIGGNTLNLVSEKNINNLLIQLSSSAIDLADMDIRDFSDKLRDNFTKQKEAYNPSGSSNKARYSKLVATGDNGTYLISKYSPKFIEAYRAEKKKLYDVNDEFGFKSKESKKAYAKFRTWKSQNLITEYDQFGIVKSQKPKNKWIDKNHTKLTNKDKEFLSFLKEKAREADDHTLGYQSLIFKDVDAEFIRLPSIRQTDLDKILSGQGGELFKEKLGDFYKIREDETDRGELTEEEKKVDETISKRMVTVNNEERHLVPIHFRSPLDPKDQSLDLPTIFLMNSAMAKEYNAKQNLEADSQLLLDIVGNSTVKQSEAITGKSLFSVFKSKDDELARIKEIGANSNVYKKLKSMNENRIYKITEASTGKIGGKDIATIAGNLNGYSANLALAVNYLSAIPNLMQGKIQNFIEGVGGNSFTRADLRWAEKTYFKELANGGLHDIGRPTNNSKIQMLIDKFDLMGDFNAIKNKFEDSSRFRAMFKSSTLHGFNQVAEHYVQSTLMLAVMKAVKIKNNKGEFINKAGKVVSEDKAMNLFDAFEAKDGELIFNKNANHSSFTRDSFGELGMLQHQNLIRKKIIDLHGQYDNKWQSHMQRYWWGKMIMMFRKWLIPAYHRRWRGAIHTLKGKNYMDLSEEQKYYDLSTREYTEGMYSSMIRFIMGGIVPGLKEMKYEIIKSNWNNLTDMEKSNIHRTLREVLVYTLMMQASMIALAAAKDGDGEDDELLYTLAYVFSRQETELAQYINVSDQMRIFRTPFAALSTIEKTTNWMSQIMPWNIGETYEQGVNKNEYKAWIKTKRMIPVISQTERSAQKSLNFLRSITE